MAIGTPVNQGHASSFNTGTSNTVTTLANINTGDVIIALGYANVFGGNFSSLSDDVGNYYQPILTIPSSPGCMSLWICNNAIAMSTGGHVIANFNGISGDRFGIQVISVSGLGVADFVPTTSTFSSAGVTSAGSVATSTLNSSSELVLGLVIYGTNPGTLTPGGSFTQIGSGGPSAWPLMAYQIVSSNAAVTWAPTWVNSVGYRSAVISFFSQTTQGFFPPDVPTPTVLRPTVISVRHWDDRPKLTLVGQDKMFAAGEPFTPPDVSNPVLAKPNLELRKFEAPLKTNLFGQDKIRTTPGAPVPPLDWPNPLPPRRLIEYPPLQNTTLVIPVFPFFPQECNSELPLRAPFMDAVVCNSAEPMDIVPPFKLRAPDNPLRYRQLPDYPVPPNLLVAGLQPPALPFRVITSNPFARTAAETLRLGEQLAIDILGIIAQPAPPLDWPNPRGYPFPMAITADSGSQSQQGGNLVPGTPIGQGTINPDLPVRARPSFINFDAAPPNLLSDTLFPQPLPPGSLENIFAALPTRATPSYGYLEVGSPNPTITTLQTVFAPPGIPYPYEEIFQYVARAGLSFTAYMEGSQPSVLLGGALNIPPISDQMLDYFFATIAVRTSYAFLYDAGPPSQLGMVLAPPQIAGGDLYIKQHRMGAPGFPNMGQPT